MDLECRKRFYEELSRLMSEGQPTPFCGRNSSTRLRKAFERLPVLFFNEIGWWFEGRRYVELYHKELRGAIAYCFDRAEAYASTKLVKDLALQVRYRMELREQPEIPGNWIAFRNGLLDLSRRRLRLQPHTPEVFCTRYLDFDYDADAECPLWRSFLEEVLPDGASRDVLQEFLGAVFIDRLKSKVETMLWLYGDGANGKSVVFEVVMGILGRENVTTRDMRELCHPSRGQFALSDIEGKLLNYCSDVQGDFTFTDLAKKLISGEPTHAERKYENSRLMMRLPLFMANTNTLPKIKDESNAWARRVKIIPFNVTIPEERQDKSLAWKLLEERSGIMAWMLEGRRRYLAQGCRFSAAPQCDRLMFSYRAQGFDVLDFMHYEGLSPIRQYVGDEGKTILTKDLYRIFCSWLEVMDAPETVSLSIGMFRTRLKRYGFLPFHSRQGSAVRAYNALASAQKRGERKIAAEPALQVKEIPREEAAPAAEGDPGRRGAVLERLRSQIEDRI